ncbi:hypothetical protein H5410_014683 [Solanum commersonii]|uniref:Uncharacterized protein n=1 Tax=Solanum commersonii TaxID=4109 RepID=A0A9J5ZRX6_SOLCO|nr:hypothetical protein H5410_014683 [Solanum commersonii]
MQTLRLTPRRRLHRPWLVYIATIARSTHVAFLIAIYWLADVGGGLPTSSVAYTHRSTDIGCGLAALSVACTFRSAIDGRGLPASRGIWASGKRCRLTVGGISQDLHVSDVTYVHLASDVAI